ncbi:TraR/DksA C4-type zinc finger protein [uncultured Serinicoccus sp.]|uniref:TraR/DksA family transcriptional regulator n=1 Tax=uncultured Serinicoccus sp. TaxID=735514 RepID=UPI002613FA71|nr:TraR/DksA C4-type zinc finger protein [uncultured Serinicoccus sp.]
MDEQARGELEAKRAEVVAQMEQLSAPVQDQGSISFGKRVGDGTAMAVDRLTAVSAHDNLQGLLAEIDTALAALEDGGYGRCRVCGERIPEGRLEARPWATTCVRHG